jgi:alpha-beta hydrolase superfamily lysophospholipase
VEVLVARLRDAGLRNVTLRRYPAGHHALLCDLVRDEVTADIVRWLATLPSGEPAGSTPG